jgi:hypothetical protein
MADPLSGHKAEPHQKLGILHITVKGKHLYCILWAANFFLRISLLYYIQDNNVGMQRNAEETGHGGKCKLSVEKVFGQNSLLI